ncbi:hypothetical protein K3495_g9177 [Podosphaera aphanis]|nr:hypothetical protein K3495_g9177 [Podosphaera aphanis]
MWTNPSSNPTSPVALGPPSPRPSHKLKYQGKRIAQIVKLKPDCVEEYKKCQANIWPEVLKQIKMCNIEDYSIFHDPDTQILFASFKYVGYDYTGDMEKMRENPKVQEWWRMMDSFQVSLVPGAKSSLDGVPAWWKGMEQVFYCS